MGKDGRSGINNDGPELIRITVNRRNQEINEGLRICRQTERNSEFRYKRNEKLKIVLSTSASRRGGRKGGSGGIPPVSPVSEIGSDFSNILR